MESVDYENCDRGRWPRGYAIAEQLLTEGHDITVVEGDPERAAYISSTLDVIVVEGRANVDQLRIANVADAGSAHRRNDLG